MVLQFELQQSAFYRNNTQQDLDGAVGGSSLHSERLFQESHLCRLQAFNISVRIKQYLARVIYKRPNKRLIYLDSGPNSHTILVKANKSQTGAALDDLSQRGLQVRPKVQVAFLEVNSEVFI